MSYYRDPLLGRICDRILDLAEPAYIKNSELLFVAANTAFTTLFGLEAANLVGTGGDVPHLETLLHIGDKERACIVFGEDQTASFADPFGKGRFVLDMERFTLADGQVFLYCVFRQPVTKAPADTVLPASHSGAVEAPAAASSRGNGTMSSAQMEQLIEAMDIGICVWSPDNRLTYFNDKLKDMYDGAVKLLWIGMSTRDAAEAAYDNYIAPNSAAFASGGMSRDEWIEDRLKRYDRDNHTEVVRLLNGSWLQSINRRLPDGSLVGLRIDVTEAKNREVLLERHIEDVGLYREMLNRLPVAAFARGPDLRLTYVNPAYAALFGRPVEDLLGGTEADLLGDYSGPVHEANRDTLVNGTDYQQEEETPVAEGRIARTIVKTGRLQTAKGTSYVIGTVIDITPIRQREILAQEANVKVESSRQDFEDIISNMDVGLVVLDRDLNVLLMNDAYKTKIWGEASTTWTGGIVGRPIRDFMYDHYMSNRRVDLDEDFESYYQRRVAEIRSGRIEPREAVLKSGAVIVYSGIPLSDCKFMLCYVDMTELRRRDVEIVKAQHLADQAYRLMRDATDTMPEGLMVLDGDRIVFSNPSLARMINVPPELVVAGGNLEDVFRATSLQNPEMDESGFENGLTRFREAIASCKDVSYNFPVGGDRWVHLEMRSRADGQSVILLSDETAVVHREAELKRLVARAEAADRAKSEFLAHMSLEIRTPMNGILGMAELLAKSALDTRQKAFIEIIMKSGNALLTIINDILDFSRLDAGHMQLKYAPFDPAEALEDVASLFGGQAAEKDLELIVKRVGHLPHMVMGDAGRFRQILHNLLSNAVKFTERGIVSASIGAVSDNHGQTILNVSVEDTGPGIPPDKLQSIFEKFSRVDVAAGRREGTGIGLALSQRLANIQGGAIAVHSNEGKGSVFTLSLPVQVSSAAGRQKPLPALVENARVLVIDDQQVARDHLLEQAGEWGFDCVGAADGATVLDILFAAQESNLAVDAIIVDSQLPDMTGPELAARIRANPAFDSLAVVLIAGHDVAAFDQAIADTRIEACLTKPIRTTVLRDTLIDAIRSGRSREARIAAGLVPPGLPAQEKPRTSEATRVHPARGSQAVAAPPKGSHVLIAEDNEVNCIFLAQILDGAGLDYRIVGDGDAVLDACRNEPPALLILDTSLPLMDGFSVARRIRAAEAGTGLHLPILGLIAHLHDTDPDLCFAAGMDDYVAKPLSPERLEEKMRLWMSGDASSRTGQS